MTDTLDPQQLLASALKCHQEGDIDKAQTIYKAVLSKEPNNFDALHLLGVVELQRGHFIEAQRLIGEALAINWVDAAALGNLGMSYLRNGQLQLALHWFEIAVLLRPGSLPAIMNAATALDLNGRPEDAISMLRRVPEASGSYELSTLLGNCLIKVQRSGEAVEAFELATHQQPGNPTAWANLCGALLASGKPARAAAYVQRTMGLPPEFYSQPTVGDSATARSAIDVPPGVPVLVNSAKMLIANGFNTEAAAKLQYALLQEPESLVVRWMLAMSVLKPVYQSDVEMIRSRRALADNLDAIRRWYDSERHPIAAHQAVGAIQPFFLVYHPYCNRELLRHHGNLCSKWMTTFDARDRPVACDTSSVRRLRIGIVSSHIREHSVWFAITKGWVEQFDRSKIDLYIFHLNETVDQETLAAKRSAFYFDNERKDIAGWIRSIEHASLDGLIYPEIGMDPTTLKLAALRLAPWQATTWGHPDTSGLPTIDAFLSSEAMEPANSEANYTEQLIRLPGLGVYCEPLGPAIADVDLHTLALAPDEPLLLCPGSPFKYAPVHDKIWVGIAKGLRKGFFSRASSGRLVFFRSHTENLDRLLEQRLRLAFEAGGVDFDAHVSIVPYLSRNQFYGLMQKSLLMLDTPGFSGFNTALQSIEGGLPILTFDGEFLRGRLASGIMRKLELPELIAPTSATFVERALRLVRNPDQLGVLRTRMLERRNLLFRDLSTVRALERYLQSEIPKKRINRTESAI